MGYYPVHLSLQGRRCVVIGGGAIAAGKVEGLLEAEADVKVVSPWLVSELQKLVEEGRIVHIARPYQDGDLAGAFLAISATDDGAVNEQVWREAAARRLLVNVVDDVLQCTFIAPAIVRRGDLTVTISTAGKAPALAVRLRQWLERTIGAEYARFLELAGMVRAPLAARSADLEQRKEIWYRLVDSDVIDLLRQQDEAGAHRRITEITGVAVMGTQRKGRE